MYFIFIRNIKYIFYIIGKCSALPIIQRLTPNFAHKFFSKTWRDEQRRGHLHEILSFAIIIMSTFVLIYSINKAKILDR